MKQKRKKKKNIIIFLLLLLLLLLYRAAACKLFQMNAQNSFITYYKLHTTITTSYKVILMLEVIIFCALQHNANHTAVTASS